MFSKRLNVRFFFWFGTYISVSNGFGSALTDFASFCHFNALNRNPARTSDDVTKKIEKVCSCKILTASFFPRLCVLVCVFMCVIPLSFTHGIFFKYLKFYMSIFLRKLV